MKLKRIQKWYTAHARRVLASAAGSELTLPLMIAMRVRRLYWQNWLRICDENDTNFSRQLRSTLNLRKWLSDASSLLAALLSISQAMLDVERQRPLWKGKQAAHSLRSWKAEGKQTGAKYDNKTWLERAKKHEKTKLKKMDIELSS
eukprot:6204226-Pleurochrysis_carterae.AAC.2